MAFLTFNLLISDVMRCIQYTVDGSGLYGLDYSLVMGYTDPTGPYALTRSALGLHIHIPPTCAKKTLFIETYMPRWMEGSGRWLPRSPSTPSKDTVWDNARPLAVRQLIIGK